MVAWLSSVEDAVIVGANHFLAISHPAELAEFFCRFRSVAPDLVSNALDRGSLAAAEPAARASNTGCPRSLVGCGQVAGGEVDDTWCTEGQGKI